MRARTLPLMAAAATAIGLILLIPGQPVAQTPPMMHGEDAVGFDMLDTDGDGVVSREEFDTFMAERPMLRQGASAEQGRMGARMEAMRDARRGDRWGSRSSGRKGARSGDGQMEHMLRDGMGGRFGMWMGEDMGMDMGLMPRGRIGEMTDEMRAEMAARMVERFDADGDGLLSAEEIAAGMEAMAALRNDPAARARAMFERLDTDGDGVISAEEFEAAHERMRERAEQMRERMQDMRRAPGQRAPRLRNAPAGD
jgi:Ca2+-binding EF-hand superfamily protein